MNRSILASFCAILALSACNGVTAPPALNMPTVPTDPLPGNDTCGRAPYAGLVGQDATVLERQLIMRQVRVIRPDTMVTMDFSPARLNFMVGVDGTIQQITCG